MGLSTAALYSTMLPFGVKLDDRGQRRSEKRKTSVRYLLRSANYH